MVGVLALILRYLHIWENNKLARAEQEAAAAAAEGGEKMAIDLTQERRAAGFRYVY